MAEYIDRQAAIDVVTKWFDKIHQNGDICIDGLRSLPDADVVERKTGRWTAYIEDGYLECPFCGAATNCDGDESELHFCFSCGAKMEGVRNDV